MVEPGPSGGPLPDGTGWRAVVLGIAQDGGVPHPGCDRDACAGVRRGDRSPERVACLGLTDGRRFLLVDATPDLPSQAADLGRGAPAGILLTHAHMGHYTGLAWLGREALDGRGIPVHLTERMAAFLTANEPWASLVRHGNVDLRPGLHATFDDLRFEALPVPHRDELSDTVGWRITGPRGSVLWLPDIDAWDAWDRDVRDEVEAVDRAFLDATFWSDGELGGREVTEVPHPRVVDTLARLEGLGDRVRLVHLNHTNPLLLDEGPARERGFRVARDGESFPI